MKKTLITLLALSGLAMGETVTKYTPFSADSAADWTMTHWNTNGASDENNATISENSFSASTSNWKRPSGTYTFGAPITLTDIGDSITFSFTVSRVVKNAVGTMAFVGTDGEGARSLVMGSTYKGTNGANNNNYAFGTDDSNDGLTYLLGSDKSWGDDSYNIAADTLTTLGSLDETTTFEGNIAWSEADSAFKFSLTEGGAGGATASYLLGDTYTLSGLVATTDGKTSNSPIFSALTITHTDVTPVTPPAPGDGVPEPTTATLSLLALAGLAARRRRR